MAGPRDCRAGCDGLVRFDEQDVGFQVTKNLDPWTDVGHALTPADRIAKSHLDSEYSTACWQTGRIGVD